MSIFGAGQLNPEDLLTPAEVARIARLKVGTLCDKRRKGTGPEYIKLSPGRGGRIRYRRQAVMDWLAGASASRAA